MDGGINTFDAKKDRQTDSRSADLARERFRHCNVTLNRHQDEKNNRSIVESSHF